MCKNVTTNMSGQRKYVAVIDDESDLVKLFSDALEAEGFKVRGFDDPLMAVDHLYIHHSEYSLVLSDIRMPGIDGFHVAKLIHQMDKEIKVILTSAFEFYDDGIKEIQIDEFIKKPIHIAELVNVIRNNLLPTQIH